MKSKQLCLIGLAFFLLSYLFFSKVLPDGNAPIDLAHWSNLIGACLLLGFNEVFPKNGWNSFASMVTVLGVVADIGLCTLDLLLWSLGSNELAKEELSRHIGSSPSLFYPFIAIGPSLLFMGLSLHGVQFLKTNFKSALMVFLSSVAIGFSFFVLKNGIYMLVACVCFVFGLVLLLFRKESLMDEIKQF